MLDERTRRRLDNTLFELVEDVARRLRADGRLAATGRLKVRWKDFSTLTRQRAFPCPTRLEEDLHAMAAALFKEIPLEQPVRLIGFGISGLMDSDTSHQLDLFDLPLETRTRKEHLDQAVDQIRAQHGRSAIRRARTLPPPHEES